MDVLYKNLPIDQSPDMAKMAEIGAEHGLTFLPPAYNASSGSQPCYEKGAE